ncbi:MAG TPA: DinB family protein [Ktedonobacterales bacterium]
MQSYETQPRDTEELLARIAEAWAVLNQRIAPLSPAQLTTPGPDGGWSVKDHLAHLATWEEMLIALLEGKPIHTAFGISRAEYDALESTDALNAVITEQHKDFSLDEVMRRFEATHTRLVALISALPDEDLSKPITHFQPDDPDGPDERPVLVKIIGDTYGHYAEHFPWIEAILAG